MLKKVVIVILLVTVVGAAGAALVYQTLNQKTGASATALSPLASEQNLATPAPDTQTQADALTLGVPVAQGMQGEAWGGVGNIVTVEDFGFNLATTEGETVYIELGPPDYWQAQNINLAAGQLVAVTGSITDGMIHAETVTLDDGQTLTLRDETGQPMWSGGVQNSNGQNGQNTGSADGTHTPNPQAQVDEWVTIEGTLIAFQGSTMSMSTADGNIVNFQAGQPRFMADQGVTFQVGDPISVLGFYQGEQFSAGEITQLATGLRVMLRDPNGRPLWAGPGNGNGNGNGGNGGNNHTGSPQG